MSVSLGTVIKRSSQKVFGGFNVRARKRVIGTFAKKNGMMYFGFVDQNSDEHKVVRGLTVSQTHRDNHYSIGSASGYNVSFVDRVDSVMQADGSSTLHNWLIMAFDLHTKQAIPHFFIGARNHDLQPYADLFNTFPNMKQVEMGTFEDYGQDFTTRFTVYARPAKSVEVERILPSKAANVIGAHFWPLSIEQHDNVLYIYSDGQRATLNLLDTMLEDGLWLAGHLDLQAELV